MTFAASQATCSMRGCDGATVCFEIDELDGAKAKPRCIDHMTRTWCERCDAFADGPHYEGRICRGCGNGTEGRRAMPIIEAVCTTPNGRTDGHLVYVERNAQGILVCAFCGRRDGKLGKQPKRIEAKAETDRRLFP